MEARDLRRKPFKFRTVLCAWADMMARTIRTTATRRWKSMTVVMWWWSRCSLIWWSLPNS